METMPNVLTDFPTYAEHFLKISDKRSTIRPLVFNPVQRKLWAAKHKAYQAGRPRRFIILKARRQGITTLEMAHSFWTIATQANRRVIMLGHEDKATETMFRIATLFYERLPEDVRPKRLTASNKRDLNLTVLRSLMTIATAGSKGAGRGDTLSKFHWAEVAWSCGGDQDLQRKLLSGLTEAASHGEAVLESTPNGVGDLFHTRFKEAQAGKGDWTAAFFTWWDDPTYTVALTVEQAEEIRNTLTNEEIVLAAAHGLTCGQIAWRRAKMEELGRLFAQEYPEDSEACFLASGSCYFSKDFINALLKGTPEHDSEGFVKFKGAEAGHKYVIGADASEGIEGGDYAVAKVIDAETEEEMALFRDRRKPEDFAHELVEIAKYYNGALIVPERNNHGHSVINTLVNQINWENVYHYLDYDPVLRKSVPKTGWDTNGKTRPVMLSALREHIEKGWLKVHDRVLLGECRMFGPNETTGKIEALSGAHDDDIIATALAIQGREQALLQNTLVGTSSSQAASQSVVQTAGRMFAPTSVMGNRPSGRMF